MEINPLNELKEFRGLARHTSGRRELRAEMLSRGVTIHARPATAEDARKAMDVGVPIATLPIRRKEPKREGMSKKAWKRSRRNAR